MLDQYLREQTKEIHTRTEGAMAHLNIFSDQFSEKDYERLLLLQYYWHKELESYLSTISPELKFDGYHYQPKVPLIEQDLAAIGISDHENPVSHFDGNGIEVPGIIYVLEGSMLGSTVIYKQLKKAGIEDQYLHFYAYCAGSAPKVWPAAKKYLRQFEDKDDYFAGCLNASIKGFQLMIDMAGRPYLH